MNLETVTGHETIHSTDMVAFQEESQFSEIRQERLKLARTKKRHVENKSENSIDIHINPKKEPSAFAHSSKTEVEFPIFSFQLLYLCMNGVKKCEFR